MTPVKVNENIEKSSTIKKNKYGWEGGHYITCTRIQVTKGGVLGERKEGGTEVQDNKEQDRMTHI